MARARPVLLMAPAALALAGCTSSNPTCPGGGAVPIIVTVIDEQSGLYICDAIVTASDGASSVPGSVQGSRASMSEASCYYAVDPLRSGTFAITASAQGLKMSDAAPTVSLSYDNCGYEGMPHDVTIKMAP
jgi:hypothetical protein